MQLLLNKMYKNKDVNFTTKIEKIDNDGIVWFKVGGILTPLTIDKFKENYIQVD